MISASGRAALVAALTTLPGLGVGTLWDNSETAYAEVAREILLSGHWIVLHLNGAAWFVQPPLYFWIAAVFAKALGPSEFAFRLPSFETVHVPILGIIENMSTFTCPHCEKNTDIFGHGGGEKMSREFGVPFLGTIPLNAQIVTSGDQGHPIVLEKPASLVARTYIAIAAELAGRLEERKPTALQPFTWTWETGEGEPAWARSAIESSGSHTTAIGLRRRDARTLSTLWEDASETDVDVRDLRLACHCARCVEEMSGRALLDPKTVRPDCVAVPDTSSSTLSLGANNAHASLRRAIRRRC